MTPNKTRVVELGTKFFASPHPEAMVYMPNGCYRLAANRAHQARFDHYTLATAPEELYTVIVDADKPPKAQFCHCDKILAVDVLAKQHCVFERLYSKLYGTQEHGTSLEFIRKPAGETRAYDVHFASASIPIPERDHVLTTRLIEVPRLKVHLTNKTAAPQAILQVRVVHEGRTIYDRTCEIRTDQASQYFDFAQILQQALQYCSAGAPAKAHDYLNEQIARYSEDDAYPERGLLTSLVGESLDTIHGCIAQLLDRLFDAPILVDQIRPELEQDFQKKAIPNAARETPWATVTPAQTPSAAQAAAHPAETDTFINGLRTGGADNHMAGGDKETANRAYVAVMHGWLEDRIIQEIRARGVIRASNIVDAVPEVSLTTIHEILASMTDTDDLERHYQLVCPRGHEVHNVTALEALPQAGRCSTCDTPYTRSVDNIFLYFVPTERYNDEICHQTTAHGPHNFTT